MHITETAQRIAANTEDAFSFEAFGETEWTRTAQALLDLGNNEAEVERMLRSKLTRWSRDNADSYEGTAEMVLAYIKKCGW
jgi:hypothetical protein